MNKRQVFWHISNIFIFGMYWGMFYVIGQNWQIALIAAVGVMTLQLLTQLAFKNVKLEK